MANHIFNSFKAWFTSPAADWYLDPRLARAEFVDPPPEPVFEPIKDKEAGPPDEHTAFNRVRIQMARCYDKPELKLHIWARRVL